MLNRKSFLKLALTSFGALSLPKLLTKIKTPNSTPSFEIIGKRIGGTVAFALRIDEDAIGSLVYAQENGMITLNETKYCFGQITGFDAEDGLAFISLI